MIVLLMKIDSITAINLTGTISVIVYLPWNLKNLQICGNKMFDPGHLLLKILTIWYLFNSLHLREETMVTSV